MRIRIKHLQSASAGSCIIMDHEPEGAPLIGALRAFRGGLMAPRREYSAAVSELGARLEAGPSLQGHAEPASLYSLTLPSPRASDGLRSPQAAPHLPRSHFCTAEILVRGGLHHFAALRHGNGRRHLSLGNVFARGRPGTVERGLRAAFAPAHRRPLR